LVYYAGDTGFGDFYQQVRDRFGAPRLAILPIGAYKPRWFMKDYHQDPWEAVEAHLLLGAAASLAVHWGTFPLADDSMDDPANDLREALREAGLGEDDFWLLDNGESREAPPVAVDVAREER
jgi:L-ascorbate metabolism protein UlaG (beta-lactamase superfamily)